MCAHRSAQVSASGQDDVENFRGGSILAPKLWACNMLNRVLKATLVLLVSSTAALAQLESNSASNTTPDNTRSEIAPRLASPVLPEGAPPAAYLQAARRAIAAGRSGEAQEALERAATRVLSRAVRPSRAGEPNGSPLIRTIAEARGAVAVADWSHALRLIALALQDPDAIDTRP